LAGATLLPLQKNVARTNLGAVEIAAVGIEGRLQQFVGQVTVQVFPPTQFPRDLVPQRLLAQQPRGERIVERLLLCGHLSAKSGHGPIDLSRTCTQAQRLEPRPCQLVVDQPFEELGFQRRLRTRLDGLTLQQRSHGPGNVGDENRLAVDRGRHNLRGGVGRSRCHGARNLLCRPSGSHHGGAKSGSGHADTAGAAALQRG